MEQTQLNSDSNYATYLITWVLVTPLTIIIYKYTNFYSSIQHLFTKDTGTNNSTTAVDGVIPRHKKRVVISIIINLLLLILNIHVWYLVIKTIINNQEPFTSLIPDTINIISENGKTPIPVSDKIINLNYKNFTFSTYTNVDNSEVEIKQCENLESLIEENISVSNAQVFDSENELKEIRKLAMSMLDSYPILRYAFRENPDSNVNEILREKWFEFGGSSTWLELYNVHYMVKRVIYATRSARDAPTLSFVYVKIFDKEWNELKGFQFPHDNQTTYPTILKLRVDEVKSKGWDDDVMGPEDPRILTRKYFNQGAGKMEEEPVIVFNAKNKDIGFKRAMHIHRAFSAPNEVFRLKIMNDEGVEQAPMQTEKNWTPFFDSNDSQDSIHFVYNYNPFTILRCKLESGECIELQGNDVHEQTTGSLRGGTNLIQLPIKTENGKLYWFGFAKSHIKNCGCIREIYRPNGILLSRGVDNIFEINYITSLLDFNIDPEPWNEHNTNNKCGDNKNVLSPNSVAFLDTDNDILGFTFSEADRNSKIVYSKGWFQHLTNVIQKDKSFNSLDSFKIGQCSSFTGQAYCESSKQKFGW